ncbi:MAG: phosphatidylserine decarboxylase [Saprospiraceae bacterium]|jgi:phosphatidylserine decarboxylase
MTLHREGKATITIGLIVSFLVCMTAYRYLGPSTIATLIYVTFSVLMILILQFFRNPQRKVLNPSSTDIIAPADGKVVVIEDTIESEYFEDERLMISIFMSPINVHSNHHPVSGTIAYEKYHPGKYLVAWHPKSSTENERHTTVYDTGSVKILTRQIAGALARRIVNYTKVGESVLQGGDMGFIKFGSRVDIYLPLGTKYNVKMGQTVKSNVDIIATL